MYAHAPTSSTSPPQNTSSSPSNAASPEQAYFQDNRPATLVQRKIQGQINNSLAAFAQREAPAGILGQTIQAKLTIDQPGDSCEREANRVGKSVVNHLHAPANQSSTSRMDDLRAIQRNATTTR